nr:hypothetical protein [Mammaliicoccus sp. Marseille-Q6498]
MIEIIVSISCLLTSLVLAIYISYSKNLKFIASIEHQKVKQKNKNKIAYIFSICLFLGTIFIIASYLLYDHDAYLSAFFGLLGIATLISFYVIFFKINK